MGALKGKGLEVAVFAVATALSAFFLWAAAHLKFMIRGILGPGAYPSVVLTASLIISVVLLVRAVQARDLRVFSPFLGGSRLDVRLKKLCAAAAGILGQPVRVMTRTGAGRFSAFAVGLAAGDDANALTVVTAEQTEIPNLHAATFVLRHFVPILRIDHDPDLLVARAESGWTDAAGAFGQEGRLRIGLSQAAEVASSIPDWLAVPAGLNAEIVYEEDWQVLLDRLRQGEVDLAVVPAAASSAGEIGDDLRRLGVFAEDAAGIVPPVPAIGGTALLSGRWSGLAATQAMPAARRDVLAQAFSEAAQGTLTDEEKDHVLSAEPFGAYLQRRDACRVAIHGPTTTEPGLGADKRTGLFAAMLATLAFPYVMELLGFPATAFLFLGGLMTLLWPRLNGAALLRIVPIALVLALGIQALFGGIFNVVFPEGSLTGF